MRLMHDQALVVLVAELVRQAVAESEPLAASPKPIDYEAHARAILDGLQMIGVPERPPAWGVGEAPGWSAPAVPERPVAPALRVSWCALCLQEAANRKSAGLEPDTVHPAVTTINGNAICNVDGRHKIVAAVAALLHQPGELPPGSPFRRAG